MVPFLRTLALAWGVYAAAGKPSAKPGSKPKKVTGSQKCERGHYGSLVKDATIPLCDAHFPADSAKSGWVILLYRKDDEGFSDTMNRVAVDLGNEPPEKSKSLKKAKKQRTRIKDLAEKYEFEAQIPKKGLEDKGKEALLKVGAVCCDCTGDGVEQEVCQGEKTQIVLVRPGKPRVTMPGGAEKAKSAEDVVKFALGELGYVKGWETASPAAEAPSASTSAGDLRVQLSKLKEQQKKAVEDEDFKLAGKLKKEIEEATRKLGKSEL